MASGAGSTSRGADESAPGHSDSIPRLVRRLGGSEGLHIGHGEYDRLFLLTSAAGVVSFEQHRY